MADRKRKSSARAHSQKSKDKSAQDDAQGRVLTSSLKRAQQSAVMRVQGTSAFKRFLYVLTNYWGLAKLPVPLKVAGEKKDDSTIEEHYKWVATGRVEDILRWAEERIHALKVYLHEWFDIVIEEAQEFKNKGNGATVEDLAKSGTRACAEERLEDAIGYLSEAIGLLELERLQHSAFIGEIVRSGGRKGHPLRWGTREEKERRWAHYQDLVDQKLKRSPMLSYEKAAKNVAAYLGISSKTIKRHTKNPKTKK